jgi:hypothetical protein
VICPVNKKTFIRAQSLALDKGLACTDVVSKPRVRAEKAVLTNHGSASSAKPIATPLYTREI